jgi:hypothetical protein
MMKAEAIHAHPEIHEHPDPSIKDLPVTLGNIPRFALLLPIRLYQKSFENPAREHVPLLPYLFSLLVSGDLQVRRAERWMDGFHQSSALQSLERRRV